MSSLTLLGDTSGSVVLDAPPISGSTVLTLPTTSGTVLTNRSAGTVLQTRSFSLSSQQLTTSTSYASSFLQQAITPSSASSKILITINAMIYVSASGGCKVTLYRGASNILASNGFYQATITGQDLPVALTYLDSPATTSEVNYNMRYLVVSGAGSVYLNINGTTANITVQEIAG